MARLKSKMTANGEANQLLASYMRVLAESGKHKLPGLRNLAQELGVSHMTVSKAIKRLAMENRILIVPGKGNYIVDSSSFYYNIGLIVCCERDPSFIRASNVLKGILEALEDRCCHLRVLQPSSLERAGKLVMERKIDACIWFAPMPQDMKRLAKISKESLGVPSVVVMEELIKDFQACPEPPVVSADFFKSGYARAESLLKLGHRRIGVLNMRPDEFGQAPDKGFDAAMADYGAPWKPSWKVIQSDSPVKLCQFLDTQELTAVIVNGGSLDMNAAFEAASEHPGSSRLDAVVDYVADLAPMLRRTPRINAIAINRHPGAKLGAAAAWMLMERLENGRLIASALISEEIVGVECLKRLPPDIGIPIKTVEQKVLIA